MEGRENHHRRRHVVLPQRRRRPTSIKPAPEQHARRAALAAEEAVVAQKESAAAEKRAADALEKQNRMAEEQAEIAEAVPWRLEHREGVKWELWNDSYYRKFKVTISGPGVSQSNPPGLIDHIDGHSSVEFWGTTTWGAKPEVVVTWYGREDAQGHPLSWTGTRPAAR